MPSATDYKSLLSAKIDSKEKYQEFERVNPLCSESAWYAYSGYKDRRGSTQRNAPWWLLREHFRMQAGIYNVTEAIRRINCSWAAQYCVHISKEDDTMVAYTPSTEAGEADKQIKTTFGKFLRRHFITLTDAQIQSLETDHRSELSAVMKIATTREELEDVYTGMMGDSGCMRYNPEHFGIRNGMHPSAAYEAPGMGVAYTEDSEGCIKSRAVVWTNPADPSDKRYVRIYGDAVLQRMLEREGYACRDLMGALIKKIPRVTGSNGKPNDFEYVVPYLDGPAGNQSHEDGIYAVDDGGEFLRLIGRSERSTLESALPYSSTPFVARAKSTSAYIKVKPLPKAEFTSDLTGITYVGFKHRKEDIWLAHAKRIGVCHQAELPHDYEPVYVVRNGDMGAVQAKRGSLKTFEHRFSLHHDTDEVRTLRGYVRLSDKYYDGAWYAGSTATLANGKKIKLDDSVLVLTAGGNAERVHNAELPAMRKQGYVNAASVDGDAVIIHKTRATAHRTKSGTWFCSDVHGERYVQTIEGDWMAKSSATRLYLFNTAPFTSAPTSPSCPPPAVVVDAFKASNYGCDVDAIMATLREGPLSAVGATETIKYIEARVQRSLQSMFGYTWEVTQADDGALQIGDYYKDHTLASARKFAAAMNQIGTSMVGHIAYESMVQQAHIIDCLDAHIQPHIAVLQALIDQQALEAAGQVRIEEAVAEDKVREAAGLEDDFRTSPRIRVDMLYPTRVITPSDFGVISFDTCAA